MSNFAMSSDIENKGNDRISEVMENIITNVENLTCSKAFDSSTESPSKSDDINKPKCDSNAQQSKHRRHRSGNKKHRSRQKKHKWKPYYKLSGVERRRLEERITRRAYRSREKMSASGLTLAPYNTTQFLMDDHYNGEPDYENIQHECKSSRDDDHYNVESDYESTSHECKSSRDDFHSSEDYYSSPDDEEEFIQQQFTEEYDSFHDDYIKGMTKMELVREHIRLEEEIDRLQSLKDAYKEKSKMDIEAEMEKIQVFEEEIKKLTRENILLQKQNEMLQNQLSKISNAFAEK